MADQATARVRRIWRLDAAREPVRLDAFIRECLPHLSRRVIDLTIRKGFFFVNGSVAKKGDRLAGGDLVRFAGAADIFASSPRAEGALEVPIIYEDSALLVVDKPAGMATHGFSGADRGTLANFLVAQRPEIAHIGNKPWEPGMVHRLDRETSGLVLIAKTQHAFQNVQSQFQRRQVQKIYRALVWGKTPASGKVNLPLAHAPGDKRRMIAVKTPRQASKLRTWGAVTRYRRLAHKCDLSLLEIAMETGVTHQIRVHLAALGHPIVADPLYGIERADILALGRQFLHAYRLKFRHPEDGREVDVVADLPAQLVDLLRRLRIAV